MKRPMKRLLPAPLLSVALFILWLLLNRSASPGNLAMALVLATWRLGTERRRG